MSSPERIARAVAKLSDHPRRRLTVPRIARLGELVHALIPRTLERLLLDALRTWHISEQSEQVSTGNLFEPGPETPGTRGNRPPQVGTARLLAWLGRRLLRLQGEAVSRLFQRARARLLRARDDITIVRTSDLSEGRI